jgi:hypothetical protein
MPLEVEKTESVQIPEDFAAFEAWRNTGELPETPTKETPAEPEAPEPEAAPDSDPVIKQEPNEAEPSAGVQKRIDKAVAKQREAERRAEEAERKLAEAQGSRPASEHAEPAKPEGRPVAEDFKSYDEYVEALVSHRYEQREQAKAQAEAQKQAQAAAVTQQSAWDERKAKVVVEHPDWEEVVGEAAIPVSRAMHDAILTSEHGPAIAYELASHPDEAKRISALPPLAAAREIGKLEAKFEAKPTPEPEKPKVSKAPKPPTPVTGGAKATPDIHDESFASDYSAWEKVRNAQLRRR